MEKETGAPCLFLQGAAGDLSANPPSNVHGPQEFGQTVGRAALDLSRTVQFDDPEKTTYKSTEDDFAFTPRIDLANAAVFELMARAFFPALVASYEREYREGFVVPERVG